ncbi:hypothetical protein EI94DRAFT_1896392 [Lactarius quietus]|nr:hypothetical protein EI94DRAFT_1896392 [Lactarius quietus]
MYCRSETLHTIVPNIVSIASTTCRYQHEVFASTNAWTYTMHTTHLACFVETSNISLKPESSVVKIPPPPLAVNKKGKGKVSNSTKQGKENIPPPQPRHGQGARWIHMGNLHKDQEEIGHWLAGMESGEEEAEDEEVMTTAVNTEDDADSDSSMEMYVNLFESDEDSDFNAQYPSP